MTSLKPQVHSGYRFRMGRLLSDSGYRRLIYMMMMVLGTNLDTLNYRFGVFEQAKLYMITEDGTLSTTGKLACGLAAGVAEAVFAVTPMETVKVKFINDMRMEKPRFRGFFHGVRTIVREEGE